MTTPSGQRSKPRSGQPASPRSPALLSSAAAAAARRIQRVYRLHRARFPAEGKVHSHSSSEPLLFQEDSRLRETLAEGFAAQLVAHARMDPEERIEQIRDQVADRKENVPPGQMKGLVRAVVSPEGEMGFTGGMELARWAYEGFGIAADQLGEEDHWRLADLQRWEVDALVVAFQLEEVEELVRPMVRDNRLPRIVRTFRERRPVRPRAGHDPMRYVVPLDEDAILEGRAGDLKIVGSPGDAFRLRRDAVRFLGHALGGFERYAWRLNPRRRRRRAGRPQRWVMHANYGLANTAQYRIMRAMVGWAHRMDEARGWQFLVARPVDLSQSPDRMRVAVRALMRRLGGGGGSGAPSKLPRAFTSVSSTRASAGLASLAGPPAGLASLAGPPSERPPSAAAVAVGAFSSTTHFGGFVARLHSGTRLTVSVFDPHGRNTFKPEALAAFEAALREEAPPYLESLTVEPVSVPADLKLQYRNEGSCGPSSLALMLSLCRQLAAARRGMRRASERTEADRPAELIRRAFGGVTDEDVVLAVQLTHGAVV
jgi:hypothetical protein